MKQVEFYLAQDIDMPAIKEITGVVFKNETVAVQAVESFNDEVVISANEITDDQLEMLVALMNAKFNLNYEAENIEVRTVPAYSVSDTISIYLLPLVLTVAISLVYFALRYKKRGVMKYFLIPVASLLLVILTCFGLMSVFRLPFNSYTMPIALGIVVVTLTVISYRLERKN